MSSPTKTIQHETQLSNRAVVVDQNQFRLSPEQWKAFCQRLDASPQVIPGLSELFCKADPFRKSDDV
ncbi:MAG: DUF1778 domain-containing protein [Janthinobacterium lividum]